MSRLAGEDYKNTLRTNVFLFSRNFCLFNFSLCLSLLCILHSYESAALGWRHTALYWAIVYHQIIAEELYQTWQRHEVRLLVSKCKGLHGDRCYQYSRAQRSATMLEINRKVWNFEILNVQDSALFLGSLCLVSSIKACAQTTLW